MRNKLEKALVMSVWVLVYMIAIFVVTVQIQAETKEPHVDEETMGYIEEISEEYGVCKWLIVAMCEAESSGCHTNSYGRIKTNGDCVGIMQVNAVIHQDRANELGVSVYDEYGNILVGTDYLMELAEEYQDLPVVLTAYNCGEYSDAVAKAIESGEGNAYAKRVMKRTEQLERLEDGQGER